MSEPGWYTGNMNEPNGTMWQYEFELEDGQPLELVTTTHANGAQLALTQWRLKFQPRAGETNLEYVRAADFENPTYDALSDVSTFHYDEPGSPDYWSFLGRHDDDVRHEYESSHPDKKFDPARLTESRWAIARH